MTAHATALANNSLSQGILYLEIEGLPYAYGSDEKTGAWFDVSGQSFEGIKPWLRVGSDASYLPRISAQRVDFLESRVSIGALRIGVADLDGSLAGYAAAWRTDSYARLFAGSTVTTHASTACTTTVLALVAGDAIKVPVGSYVRRSGEVQRVSSRDTTADTITLATGLTTAPGTGVSITVSDLAADATATTANISGDPGTGSSYTLADGVVWAGIEAMDSTRTGRDLALTRGLYRSRLRELRGRGAEDLSQYHQRALLTPYPRVMRGRRVWLKWGLDAANDSETVTLFAGTIASLPWTDTGRTLVVECEDSQTWLRQPIFTDLGERIAPGALATYNSTNGIVRFSDPPRIANGETILIATGGGIVAATRDSATDARHATSAPVAGKATTSATPAPVRAAIVTAYDPASTTIGAIPYAHPLELALAILTSTGTGTNGTYDTLPQAWGLGIPESDINTAEIADLIARFGNKERHRVVITEPVEEAREWIIQTLLKPFGYYLRAGYGAPISISRIEEMKPADTSTAATIGIGDLATERGGIVTIDGPAQENTAVLGGFVLKTAPIIDDDGVVEFESEITIQEINANDSAAFQSAPKAEITSWLGAPEGSIGWLRDGTTIEKHFPELMARLRSRFAFPPSILRVTCWMRKVSIDPGDIVSVTLPNLPNSTISTRGITAAAWECWSKEIDLARGVVVLELAQTNHGVTRARYLSPSCDLSASGYTGTTLTVAQNNYTPGGGIDDTDAFEIGDVVRVYSASFADRSAATTVTGKTATTITLASAVTVGGGAPASGGHILLGDYGDAGMTAAAKAKWAWRAGPDGMLDTTTEPHTYS